MGVTFGQLSRSDNFVVGQTTRQATTGLEGAVLIVSVFYVVRPRAALPAGPPDQHQSAHVHPCNNTVSVTLQPDALPRRLPPTGQRLLATYHSAVFGIGSNPRRCFGSIYVLHLFS